MKKIPLNKGLLELPRTWDELTYKQKLFAFDRLKEVFEGKLSPATFRLQVLANITGYKPGAHLSLWLIEYPIYLALFVPAAIYFRIKQPDKYRFHTRFDLWKQRRKPRGYDPEIIRFNLYRLSEQINFAFDMQESRFAWKRRFAQNPIPYINIRGRSFTGKKFNLGIAPFSNITAREFSDCFDLYVAYHSMSGKKKKQEALDRIISILYPGSCHYRENLASNHADVVSALPEGVKFGILYWFSGIVEYYTQHPYFSILFAPRDKTEDEDKISLGMNEVVLMIKKNGYDDNGSVNDFFEAQLKILKDNLCRALASGVTIEDLANKTKISITDINRLT